MSFAGMRHHLPRSVFVLSDARFRILSDARTRLPQTPVRASVDARSCICRTSVPVSVRMGIGWKLYYDAYRTIVSSGFANSFWTNSVPQIVRSAFVSASVQAIAKVATIFAFHARPY